SSGAGRTSDGNGSHASTLKSPSYTKSVSWQHYRALVPDTVDYGEWKTGIRAEGSVYTGYTFFRKISAALAGFLPGIMLTQIGYVPNIAQSDATLQGLRQLIFIWPCALAIIAALTMGFFYTLNEKRFALIIEEINQRKNKEIETEEKTASVTL
ncbi:MFS transporter, partial [Escherichia coli]|uniref:MFS transporter n=1 Tax=Escherichia coli TaxID=562 RepID=UPI00202188A1